MREELRCRFVDLCAGNLESNDLVGLSSKQQILVPFIERLNPLLIRRHETMPGISIIFNFRIFNLKQKRALLRIWIILLCDSVSRPANLNGLSKRDLPLMRLRLRRGVLGLPRRPLGEISLVSLPLSVRQVVPLVVVQRQAKLALITPEVVSHEVGVLGEVDGLEG